MAGDWIKVELGTPDKPEVWAIAASLNIDPDAVFGKMIRVWGWFDQHTEEGNAPSVTKMLLDRTVGVTGFCDAVCEAGWMKDEGGLISLPNFDRHNGKTAKTRALTAKRVAQHKVKTNANGNGDSVSEVTQDTLPREEKRRIKKKIPKKKTDLDFTSWPSMPDQQVLDDWCAMRKRIKADVSQTVVNRFSTELHKAVARGYTVNECLAECVTRNWRGFKDDWMKDQPDGEAQSSSWHETRTGIIAKGQQIGLTPDAFPDFQAFRNAVYRKEGIAA